MQINMFEAKTQLSKLIEKALAGEEIIIARAGKPVVKLVPVIPAERKPGRLKGQVWMADDFDEMSAEELALWYDGPLFPPTTDDKGISADDSSES